MTAAPNFAYRRVGQVRPAGVRRRPRCVAWFALNGGEPIDCDGFATFLTEMGRFGLWIHTPPHLLRDWPNPRKSAVTAPRPGTGLRIDEIHHPATDSVQSVRRAG